MTYTVIPRMLTIKQLAAECKGTGITEWFIRSLVLENKIAYVKAGNKYLVNYDRFVEFLNTPMEKETPQPTGTIRRIPEKLRRSV